MFVRVRIYQTFSDRKEKNSGKKAIVVRGGFTLIELLVVMAILGILGVIVLLLINPTEQIARANDTGRVHAVNQLGHQVQAYFTIREGIYPDPLSWDTDLVETNQLGSFPPGISYNSSYGVTNCQTNQRPSSDPTFCYDLD